MRSEKVTLVGELDDGAFERLLCVQRPWILRRCRSWLRSQADAEDVAQEVLMRLCSGLHGLQQSSRFQPWVARIVDNQCKSFLKRNRRWVTVEHIEELIDLLQHNTAAAYDESVDDEAVRRAVTQLPESASQVLYLRFFQDQSLEQVAQCLDISLSAAKMRLYRALDRFAIHYRAIET